MTYRPLDRDKHSPAERQADALESIAYNLDELRDVLEVALEGSR